MDRRRANPDGSLGFVNDDWGTTPQRFNVSAAGRSFAYGSPPVRWSRS